MRGTGEYRQRPRNSQHRRKSQELKKFGLARNVDSRQSVAFFGLLKQIPRLSGYEIGKKKIKSHPSQKLLNFGLVESVIQKPRKIIEQKDLWRWEDDIINAVNGRGHQEVPLDISDLQPFVVESRGKSIGSLVVRKESEFYEQLRSANQVALDSLKDSKRADSSSQRPSLEPRIDIFDTHDPDSARIAIDRFAQELVAREAAVILEPAKGYREAA